MRFPFIDILVFIAMLGISWLVWWQRNKIQVQDPSTEGIQPQRTARLTYEESCKVLQHIGQLQAGEIPPRLDHPPRYDDEILGLNFFRTLVSGSNMENLSLARTYFGKSEVGPISFKNTDFSESTFCWNDFNKVDFTDADLSKCDLRASLFTEVKFVRTNLSEADLRRSTFENCIFTDAKMNGTKLTGQQARVFAFSARQLQEIDWQDNEGEEPDGG